MGNHPPRVLNNPIERKDRPSKRHHRNKGEEARTNKDSLIDGPKRSDLSRTAVGASMIKGAADPMAAKKELYLRKTYVDQGLLN